MRIVFLCLKMLESKTKREGVVHLKPLWVGIYTAAWVKNGANRISLVLKA